MDVFVHGGASPRRDGADRQGTLTHAAKRGAGTDGPVEAVVTAIGVLEADPAFNAGVGSAVQSDGRIRTDAGIMRSDGSAGAACAMPGVVHAIAVADVVRRETPHVLLTDRHAVRLATAFDIDTDRDLWTEWTRNRWAEEVLEDVGFEAQLEAVGERFGAGHDTVGAVATDGERVVAGTSTGGRWLALAGRVGDVPQIGSGFYASSVGAVSTTGSGEGIATVTLARLAERELADGKAPQTAADTALETFDDRGDGTAGLILMTPEGDVGSAYSSESMETAFAEG